MAKYPILTDEMFREMMQSDKGIREARYATGYGRWVNGESVTDGHYVNWPDYRSKREISEEQMAEAKRMYDKRHDEVLEYVSKKGVLCFHAMGMNYEPTVENGIGNYRIRATFKDKSGHVWFIEIHPKRNERCDADEGNGFWGEVYDESWNARAMEEYKNKRSALLEKYGAWYKSPSNERPVYPMTKYDNIVSGEPYGYDSILAWVNRKFKTDYKELYLERYFLSCDETISEC